MSSVYFSYFHGKAFPGKPATITFGENKDVSWIKFRLLYDNSFAPALGGACAMGTNTMALIQTCQIQAIMTVPKRLSFSVQLSNCNLATCWHIELSILGLFHLSISIRAIALVALWNSRGKNLDVQCLHFPISMGRLSQANLQQSPSAKTRMKTHRSNLDCRLYNNSLASALGGACAMGTNTMALIQTCQIQAIMTVPHRQSFSARLTNCNLATCWHIS